MQTHKSSISTCPIAPTIPAIARWLLAFVALGAASLFQSASADDFLITDFGAKQGGNEVNTHAIQQTINQAAAAGGGRVVVPSGTFRTGALHLKPKVELHLAEGAVLLGSTELEDYPKRMTRIEGHFEPWRPALINAEEVPNVRISGSGTLDGNGKPFWAAFWKRRKENPKCTNLEVERPRLIYIDGASEVHISGIHLKNSGFWNLHLYRCQSALVEGLTITAPHGDPPKITDVAQPWDELSIDRAPSSDGIDIDSCRNVTIRKCTISVGDDCIALKGSKGPLAMRDESSPPVENVLVTNCNFLNGHGMLTCGSEATVIRNVTVRNSTVGNGVPVVRFKLRPDTPQLYENFVFENLKLDSAQALFDVKPWTQFFDLGEHEPPASVVQNVVLRNIQGTARSIGELRGNSGDMIRNIFVQDVDVRAQHDSFRHADIDNLAFSDFTVNGEPYRVED
ncbi:glycosyl hydrolase family 28 protein [Aeoliella sp. ICT_H6.2]|uniref:Glycosyl hydrolase family 28 protein n=1 Tax=Aeoliella straminimaris TaxID=2954799 RepID=A0A9X2F845_9BACT|nr:glycosyl hydrolase family 28 protein [Aeoliella straminimaris]MCO6044102.1 glycosyl hydrolase family 28 protein [Aeoliella straminimaris]